MTCQSNTLRYCRTKPAGQLREGGTRHKEGEEKEGRVKKEKEQRRARRPN